MPDVTIAAGDGGSFSAYLAGDGGPGILICQEIFGVNHVMRDLADGFAAQGYLAICPDLFWRQEPGIQITDKTDEEWARAFELYQGFDEAKGVDDLIATLAHLRGVDGCSGKVGTVGYCLGGKLAYLMATRSDADCNVGYYGVGIEAAVEEAGNISKPLLLHVAEEDEFVPKDAQQKVHAALDGNPHVTIHDYAGMDHAFARVGGAHYDQDQADLANGRTAAFFKEHLG
ncbi:MAG: dienelactone hydrolase family protein [Alphaproteobacteria bacterium]|nr:dienelactone hydrolase family protein [Alphaproteobacteria bacterium]